MVKRHKPYSKPYSARDTWDTLIHEYNTKKLSSSLSPTFNPLPKTEGNTGGWYSQTYSDPPSSNTWTQQQPPGVTRAPSPFSSPPYSPSPYTWGSPVSTIFDKQPGKSTKQTPKNHSAEELKGKLVAYATIKYAGLEQTGILFVRKCGAWKLIECSSMTKVASGSQDTPLPDLTIHYIIYSQLEETQKKKGRFDDIGILETPAE